MSLLLYKIGMRLYASAIALASITNPKAKQWVAGRKNIFEEMRRKINTNEKYIWIHCASAGEFEQGRPLIEALREKYESYKIILTFFSPSGYELRKNYNGAHLVFYLPADVGDNAKRFIDLVRPKLAIFVKYEFWLGYLNELKNQNIPHVLIAARFDDDQIFFKWYGKMFRDALKGFKMLFVQDEKSCELLKSIGVTNCMLSGDTRYDRVIEIAKAAEAIPLMEQIILKDEKVLIAGSTWAEDEKLLNEWYKKSPEWKLVIVPHEINREFIINLKKQFGNEAILWSDAQMSASGGGAPMNRSGGGLITKSFINKSTSVFPKRESTSASGGQEFGGKRVLIVDTIGLLSRLYRYATVCYVGGGFGKGIHNTLEAAVYGKPVMFGPNYKRFREAEALVQTGGGICVRNANELLIATKSFVNDATSYKNSCDAAARLVAQGSGATVGIVKELETLL
jgi:3-deoxy-D-manno-octulosonic-acid transferase